MGCLMMVGFVGAIQLACCQNVGCFILKVGGSDTRVSD